MHTLWKNLEVTQQWLADFLEIPRGTLVAALHRESYLPRAALLAHQKLQAAEEALSEEAMAREENALNALPTPPALEEKINHLQDRLRIALAKAQFQLTELEKRQAKRLRTMVALQSLAAQLTEDLSGYALKRDMVDVARRQLRQQYLEVAQDESRALRAKIAGLQAELSVWKT